VAEAVGRDAEPVERVAEQGAAESVERLGEVPELH
jgi:hypothetical protein